MSKEPLSLEALTLAFERWGSDLARWPVAEAKRAAAAIETSEPARRLWAEAHALDVLLDSDATPLGVGSRTRANILDSVRSSDIATRFLAWLTRGPFLLRPAALALIPLLVGLGAGIGSSGLGSSGLGQGDADLAAQVHALAFDNAEDYHDAE